MMVAIPLLLAASYGTLVWEFGWLGLGAALAHIAVMALGLYRRK